MHVRCSFERNECPRSRELCSQERSLLLHSESSIRTQYSAQYSNFRCTSSPRSPCFFGGPLVSFGQNGCQAERLSQAPWTIANFALPFAATDRRRSTTRVTSGSTTYDGGLSTFLTLLRSARRTDKSSFSSRPSSTMRFKEDIERTIRRLELPTKIYGGGAERRRRGKAIKRAVQGISAGEGVIKGGCPTNGGSFSETILRVAFTDFKKNQPSFCGSAHRKSSRASDFQFSLKAKVGFREHRIPVDETPFEQAPDRNRRVHAFASKPPGTQLPRNVCPPTMIAGLFDFKCKGCCSFTFSEPMPTYQQSRAAPAIRRRPPPA